VGIEKEGKKAQKKKPSGLNEKIVIAIWMSFHSDGSNQNEKRKVSKRVAASPAKKKKSQGGGA